MQQLINTEKRRFQSVTCNVALQVPALTGCWTKDASSVTEKSQKGLGSLFEEAQLLVKVTRIEACKSVQF